MVIAMAALDLPAAISKTPYRQTFPLDDCIAVALHKQKVSFNSGGFLLSVPANSVSEFPKSPILDSPKVLILDAGMLHKELSKAIRFVSKDDLRPAMKGVCLIDYNKELYIVATDAHRMYWSGIIKTPANLSGVSAIISQKCVRLFIEIFKTGSVEISLTGQYIRFETAAYSLISRLIDCKYPDFYTVIPKNTIQFCCKRKQLISFFRMAAPFVSQSSNRVNLEVKNDVINLTGDDADFQNELSYKMPVYHTENMPDSLVFSINLKSLRDQLSISDDEYCKFLHSGNPMKPIVIDDHSLLMPLMTNL